MDKKSNRRTLKFRTNIYLATLYQLGVVMVVLTLTRLFFYFYNHDFFTGITGGEMMRIMWGGLRFDLAAAAYLNIVFIVMRLVPLRLTETNRVYNRIADWFYYIPNSVGIIANLMDTPFYQFTNARTTAGTLSEFAADDNAAGIVVTHIGTFWYFVPIAAALIFLLVWGYRRAVVRPLRMKNRAVEVALRSGLLVLGFGLVAIAVRGGLQKGRPMMVSDAILYVSRNRDMPLVQNTPYTVIRTVGKKITIDKLEYMPPEAAAEVYYPLYTGGDAGGMDRKNVFIVVMEGIGSGLVDAVNNIEGFRADSVTLMPFLDSLARESYIFTNAYSTGRSSSQGLTAILGGFPAFAPLVYMHSPYSNNQLDGVPELLAGEGYSSVFYCGCSKGSYAFEALSRAVGYRRFVGREEYGNDADYDGTWGIFDDKMAKYVINDVSKEPEPFIGAWFNLDTHHPFVIPEEFRGRYRHPDRTHYQTVEYYDDVLKGFFADAARHEWYANTLFIIVADHGSLLHDPVYNGPNTLYKVPIILYTPDGSIPKGIDEKPASQIDIAPTILGYLNYGKPRISFGQDLLDPEAPRFAVSYVNGLYQIVEGDYLLQFDGVGSVALFDKTADPTLQDNIIDAHPDTVAGMELQLKAFLQDYTHRLTENRMSADRESGGI